MAHGSIYLVNGSAPGRIYLWNQAGCTQNALFHALLSVPELGSSQSGGTHDCLLQDHSQKIRDQGWDLNLDSMRLLNLVYDSQSSLH